ncbi:MAG: YtxH domain-containing protein [Saprospiraceae bacterium]
MSNRNSKGGLFTFLVGIAAGAAAGYYLSTEEGRRMREKLSERTGEFTDEASRYAKEKSEKVNHNLNEAMEQGRHYVNDLTDTVKHKVDEYGSVAREKMDQTSSAFQEGVSRGKTKLNQQKAEIDSLINDVNSKNS